MKSCTRCLILAIACNTSMMLLCSRASGQLFDVPWIGYDTAVYPEGLWPYASVTADFNGDGVPDLAASAWDGTPWFSVLMGDGMGGFAPPQLYPLQLVSQDLVAEDFDRDGDVDLAIAESGPAGKGSSLRCGTTTGPVVLCPQVFLLRVTMGRAASLPPTSTAMVGWMSPWRTMNTLALTTRSQFS